MTERLMSYVRGFSATDYYSAEGAFRGSLPAGFMVSALFRNRRPIGVTAVSGTIASQFVPNGIEGAGWSLSYFTNNTTGMRLQFLYAAAAAALESAFVDLANTPFNQGTMLVTFFFGVPKDDGDAPEIQCWINGVRMTLDGDPAAPIDNGYLPAPADSVFELGRSVSALGPVPGEFAQVSGFAYYEGLPTGTDNEIDAAIADLAAAQWDGCSFYDDMVAGADFGTSAITDSFSVRRGCPRADATWPAQLGAIELERQAAGSPNLSIYADKPKYWSGTLVQPGPV